MEEIHDLGEAYIEVIPQKFEIKPENLKVGKMINNIETIVKVENDKITAVVVLSDGDPINKFKGRVFHLIYEYKNLGENMWEEGQSYLVNPVKYQNILNELKEKLK